MSDSFKRIKIGQPEHPCFYRVWAILSLCCSHGGLLCSKKVFVFSSARSHALRPDSARERAKPVGGAVRRPDKSEHGVCLQTSSDLFYQKFINDAVARKKG